MANTLTIESGGQGQPPFASQHRWDRNFFLFLVSYIWVTVLAGFGLDLVDHFQTHRYDYLWIVHLHAVVFVCWLVLLTVQLALVRNGRVDVHRKLGAWGMGLATFIPPLGLLVSWMAERQHHGTVDSDASFFSFNIVHMVCFALLVGAAYRLRRDPSAHKRLILLATLFLSVAGFARLWTYTIGSPFGEGFWPVLVSMNSGPDLAILALGGYDLFTRSRLHPAYVAGALLIFASQLFANWLYFNPAWKDVASWIAGY